MVRVVVTGSGGLRFTQGVSEFEANASNVRQLILELDRLFPGLGTHVERRMAIAINGEVHQDAYSAELDPGSEICLFPKIVGGHSSSISPRS
jgi:sulfur-carrier protein